MLRAGPAVMEAHPGTYVIDHQIFGSKTCSVFSPGRAPTDLGVREAEQLNMMLVD